jgi:hypothetical protein
MCEAQSWFFGENLFDVELSFAEEQFFADDLDDVSEHLGASRGVLPIRPLERDDDERQDDDVGVQFGEIGECLAPDSWHEIRNDQRQE